MSRSGFGVWVSCECAGVWWCVGWAGKGSTGELEEMIWIEFIALQPVETPIKGTVL